MLLAMGLVAQNPAHRFGQSGSVIGPNQFRCIFQIFGQRGAIGRDGWDSARHRLERRKAESLLEPGEIAAPSLNYVMR